MYLIVVRRILLDRQQKVLDGLVDLLWPLRQDAVRHFDKAEDLREQIIDARFWAGLHNRFSTEAGVTLGRRVADYDLRHAFKKMERED